MPPETAQTFADVLRIPTLSKGRFLQLNFTAMQSQQAICDVFAAAREKTIAIDDCRLFDAKSLLEALSVAGCKSLRLSGLQFQRQTTSQYVSMLTTSLPPMTHLEDLELGCVYLEEEYKDGDYLSVIPHIARCPSLRTLKLHTLVYDTAMDEALADYVLHTTVLEELNVFVPWVNSAAGELTSPALLTAMRSNYTLKRVRFSAGDSDYNGDPLDADFKAETETLTRLNRSGRAYMEGDAGNCHMALTVLGTVSDSLDCVFVHLRENPLPCQRQEQPNSPNA